MSIQSNLPDFGEHRNLLVNLAKLNPSDKIRGRIVSSSKDPSKRQVRWKRDQTGYLQNTSRTANNIIQNTKETVSWGVGQLWKSVTSYIAPSKSSSDAAKSSSDATGTSKGQPSLNESFDEFNFTDYKKNDSTNNKIVDNSSELSIRVGEDFFIVERDIDDLEQEIQYNLATNKSVLANAESSSTEIEFELKDLQKNVEKYGEFIKDSDDMPALEKMLKDLEVLDATMKAAKTGLGNLTQTYKNEEGSVKNYLKDFAVAGTLEKYSGSRTRLEKAEVILSHTENVVSSMITDLKTKIEKNNVPPLPELDNEVEAFKDESFLPADYPVKISQDPKNIQVALGQIFADPALGAILYDDRQMRCDEDGGIYLAGKGDPIEGKNHVLNFLDSLKETYGIDIRNELNNQHNISAWSSLTWGNIKTVIATIPGIATSDFVSGLSGDEKLFKILPIEKRQIAIDNPSQYYLEVRDAMNYLPDGKGDRERVEESFGKEVKEQSQRLMRVQTQKKTGVSKQPRRPHKEGIQKNNQQGSANVDRPSKVKEPMNETKNEIAESNGEAVSNEGRFQFKAKEERKFEFDPESYEFPLFHPISKDLPENLRKTALAKRHGVFLAAKKPDNALVKKMNETYQSYVESKKIIEEMEIKLGINKKSPVEKTPVPPAAGPMGPPPPPPPVPGSLPPGKKTYAEERDERLAKEAEEQALRAEQGTQLELNEVGKFRLQLEQAKKNMEVLKPELQEILFGAGKKNEVSLPGKKFDSLSQEQLAKLKDRYVLEAQKLGEMDQVTWERTIYNPEVADVNNNNIKAMRKATPEERECPNKIFNKYNGAASVSNEIIKLKNTLNLREKKLEDAILKFNTNAETTSEDLEIITKSEKPEYKEETASIRKDIEENMTKLNDSIFVLKKFIGSNKEDPVEIIEEAKQLRQDVMAGKRDDFVQAQLRLNEEVPGKTVGLRKGPVISKESNVVREAIEKGDVRAKLKRVEVKEKLGYEDILGKVVE